MEELLEEKRVNVSITACCGHASIKVFIDWRIGVNSSRRIVVD